MYMFSKQLLVGEFTFPCWGSTHKCSVNWRTPLAKHFHNVFLLLLERNLIYWDSSNGPFHFALQETEDIFNYLKANKDSHC